MGHGKKELPRQKMQTTLKQLDPDATFHVEEYEDKRKVILTAPGGYRGFIWASYGTCLTGVQEDLATDYLIKVRD